MPCYWVLVWMARVGSEWDEGEWACWSWECRIGLLCKAKEVAVLVVLDQWLDVLSW